MNPKRIAAVARKVVRTLRRDKRSLALMVLAPTVAMFVFGIVFGTEIDHVPVAVVNDDAGDLADRILANVSDTDVDVVAYDDWAAARAAVREGDVEAAWRFPANFTFAASPTPGPGGVPQAPEGAEVEVYLEGTNAQVVAVVRQALASAVQETLAGATGGLPVDVETEQAYAEGAVYMDFFVPGIMAFAALMFTTLLTVLSFVAERTSGTLSRLLVTPVTEGEVVVGYALAFSGIATVQGLILLGVAVVAFDALIAGSLLLVVLVVVLMALDALTLGILMSAAAKREAQAVQLFPLVAFPTFLLAGIFIPVESLPDWLAPLAWAIPPTYAVEALRAVMLRGQGLETIWWHVAALVGFAALFLGLSVLGLRRVRARDAT